MAWTEAERVSIRRYLGFSRFYLTEDPRLESAITGVQQVSDGGLFPDTSTEVAIRGMLASLATIETQMDECAAYAMAMSDNGTSVDYGYRMQLAMKRGRLYIGAISDALQCSPRRDYFSSVRPRPQGPFRTSES
ncbi:MAG: hypothetical protein NVS3B7_10130 [Candidatus Elarobacter sp.]